MTKKKISSTKGDLAAVVHYPDALTDKLAILCPGFLDSKDYAHLVALASELSKAGYTVVRFDPTGTWESAGVISDYTTTQYLADIKNVLDCMLQERPYAHVLLGGHSRGGTLSILYAARDTRITQVLGIMPANSLYSSEVRRKWQNTGFRFSKRDTPNDETSIREFYVPYTHLEDADKYNVSDDIKSIIVPIILIAGEFDQTTPVVDVKTIYDSANEPKKFIIIPKIGHSYRHNVEEIEVVDKTILEALLSQHVL